MATTTHKNGRRLMTTGPVWAVSAFALALARKGERVRVNVAWDGSFHAAWFSLACLHGDAVRCPMTAYEIEGVVAAAERHAGRLFNMSRKAD